MDLPGFVQIEPVGQCNLRCRMCPIQFREDGGPGRPPAFMAYADFCRIIDQFPGLTELHLQGLGEPLMHLHFFDMVRYAVERGIRVSTNTNLTILTEDFRIAGAGQAGARGRNRDDIRAASLPRLRRIEPAVAVCADARLHRRADTAQRGSGTCGLLFRGGPQARPQARRGDHAAWHRINFGNLAEDGIDAIWNNDAYTAFRAQLDSGEPPDVCRSCAVYRGTF